MREIYALIDSWHFLAFSLIISYSSWVTRNDIFFLLVLLFSYSALLFLGIPASSCSPRTYLLRGLGISPNFVYDKNKGYFIFVNLAFGRPNSILAIHWFSFIIAQCAFYCKNRILIINKEYSVQKKYILRFRQDHSEFPENRNYYSLFDFILKNAPIIWSCTLRFGYCY